MALQQGCILLFSNIAYICLMKRSMYRIVYVFIVVIGFMSRLNAQPWFKRIDTIPVYISNTRIENAWSGGINYGQFSKIDFNGDGIKDLFVFDKTGNKISTFINKGTPNTVDFHFSAQYRSKFPAMNIWVLLLDYNCDGKEDIFTYARENAGIKVFRNDGDANGLKFSLVNTLLLSNIAGNLNSIFVNATDIPAITDMDEDGDIDLLTFNSQGEFMNYHRNLSKEKYGHCDSLTFEMASACWGNFSEDPVSSSIILGKTCKSATSNNPPPSGGKHAGACQLCFDLDGDKDKEIIISDFANTTITMLTNGGDVHTANMVAQQVNFPANTMPVNLPVFPCGFYLDVNNDNLNDLLVSPNILNNAENSSSVIYYKNAGTASNVIFEYQKNNFLQDGMIDLGEGAYPAFIDYNSDGLLDLLVGNYGYYTSSSIPLSKMALFENTGTATRPEFRLITKDFADLSILGLRSIYPSFGDLDGDGDVDMLIGEYEGELRYYENIAGPGKTINFSPPQPAYAGIDVGQFSMPQIVDVDRDGKLDLLIGSKDGKLSYYKNEGTITAPAFKLITKSFGGVHVVSPGLLLGYSAPFLFDHNGSYKLFVGSEGGQVFFYDNIDGNLSGNFTLVDSTYFDLGDGVRTAVAGKDINNDGLMDIVIGNHSGGLCYYAGQSTSSIGDPDLDNKVYSFQVFPVPADDRVSIKFNGFLSEPKNISIYNLLSQRILSYTTADLTSSLNVSMLPAGVYICKVSYKGAKEYSQRFIIQR